MFDQKITNKKYLKGITERLTKIWIEKLWTVKEIYGFKNVMNLKRQDTLCRWKKWWTKNSLWVWWKKWDLNMLK